MIFHRVIESTKKLAIPRFIQILTAILIVVIIVFAFSFVWEQVSGWVNYFGKQRGIDARGFAMGLATDPPDLTEEKAAKTFSELGRFADIALIEEPVAWNEYIDWKGEETVQTRRLREKVVLARKQGLQICLVLDPLNATDHGSPNFPKKLEKKNFGSIEIKNIYEQLAIRLATENDPEYFALASEINTYNTLNKADFDNFEILYKGVYQEIKSVRPKTKVFVTWQYEDLQGLWWWDELHDKVVQKMLVKRFEDFIDLFAITTFPGMVFESPLEMPADFYERSAKISRKKLAIVESGWASTGTENGFFVGNQRDQALYVALMPGYIDKVKPAFWVYKYMYDLDLESYKPLFAASQMDPDVMSVFSSMGLKDTEGESKRAFRNWHNIYTNEEGRNM